MRKRATHAVGADVGAGEEKSLDVFRRRRGTPPQACIKGLIYRYELPVPVGSRSAPMGTPPLRSFSPPYQSVKTSSAGVPFRC
jgi:hypothetical protein